MGADSVSLGNTARIKIKLYMMEESGALTDMMMQSGVRMWTMYRDEFSPNSKVLAEHLIGTVARELRTDRCIW